MFLPVAIVYRNGKRILRDQYSYLRNDVLVYCIIHISQNDLPEFPSAVLSSIDDATASPHSSALQIENSFCVILLKVNDTVH